MYIVLQKPNMFLLSTDLELFLDVARVGKELTTTSAAVPLCLGPAIRAADAVT